MSDIITPLAVNTTWNPSDIAASTLSNGNLTVTPTGIGGVRSIYGATSGKYYFELNLTAANTQNFVGIANATATISGGGNLANGGTGGAGSVSTGGIFINGASQGTISPGFTGGGTCCVAMDMGGKLIWFRSGAAGGWNPGGTGNPAAGTGGLSFSGITGGSTTLYAMSTNAVLSGSSPVTANFGDSAFVGAVPSGFAAGFPGTAAAGATQARVLVMA